MENQNPPPFPPNPPQGNPYQQNPVGMQQDVPNATLVLVLGICSIVIGCAGPILGIIGLVMSNSAKKLYEANPGMYKESSYKNLNAGRICSIIGLCLSSLAWIIWIIWFIFVASVMSAASNYEYYNY
jgi:hypothetical protein